MQTFSTLTWKRCESIVAAIFALPFNKDLEKGTLAASRFRHYMIQDALYLEAFARALSIISAKSRTPEHVAHFAEAAKTAIIVERSLHKEYFAKFGITADDYARAEMSPVCDHYTNFLLCVAMLEPVETSLAAVLPCFWIYREVGNHIHARSVKNNPYQAWIDTYASKDFADAVDMAIAITNKAALGCSEQGTEAMHSAFKRSTQLEWMFWDSAYHEKTWQVG